MLMLVIPKALISNNNKANFYLKFSLKVLKHEYMFLNGP